MSNLKSSKGLLGLPLGGLICLAGAWSISAIAPGQEPAPTGQATPQKPEAEEQEHTKLQLGMKNLRRGMKALRPMLGEFDANQADIIKTLESMESSLLEGYSEMPPRPDKEMTDTQWAQYRVAYRQKIHVTLGAMLEMQLAAHKGDGETVIGKYRELGRHKKDGHGTFKLD